MGLGPTVTTIPMTTYSRSDIEVRVQVAVPQAGIFTLGQSLLNGSDVLGSAYQWDIYQDDLVEVSHTRRNDVTSGIFCRPVEQVATIVARSGQLDPNLNADIHPNTKIKLDWKPVVSGTWQNLITGYISAVQSQYNYQGNVVVTIEVEDMMRRFLNAPIASYTRTAQEIWSTLDNLVPLGFTAAGLDDTVYTPTFPNEFPFSAGIHGALSYTNTTVGAIINDLMDAELGLMYFAGERLWFESRNWQSDTIYEGYTKDFDNFTQGYSSEYLFSDIYAAITSAPTVVYSKSNTDVSSFFGTITQNVVVNLKDAIELDKWMISVVQYSPGIRVSDFSTPYFVPIMNNDLVKVIDDFTGKTDGVLQSIVESTITVDPTSVSTSMQLFQPV